MGSLSEWKKKTLRKRSDYRLLQDLVPRLQVGDSVQHPAWEGDARVVAVSDYGVRFDNTLFVPRDREREMSSRSD